MPAQKNSGPEARAKRAFTAGYIRGVQDLATIMLNIVSVNQASEILERFERLEKPTNGKTVVQS